MAVNLRPSKAPNIPIAPVDYSQQYQDQFINALRLYFTQIDNFTGFIAQPISGTTDERPAIQLHEGQLFFDTTLSELIVWNGTAWVTVIPPSGPTVTSFSAGTTGFTPNTSTTGAVTLSGVLGIANGGTGTTTGVSNVLTGSIQMWPTGTAPSGYLLCNGSAVSAGTYPDLFSVVGYTFGGSAGSFLLPNYTNRMPYGTTVGATGGSADAIVVSHTHTATVTDPGHAHTQDINNIRIGAGTGTILTGGNGA
jgi:hypothetical protein